MEDAGKANSTFHHNSIQEKGPPMGSLYCMDGKEKKMKHRFGPVAVSNGLAWSSDKKTMYYIDSPTKEGKLLYIMTRKVVAFDYNLETGAISNKRTIIKIEDGWPDGMTIDQEGLLSRKMM